MSVSMRVRGAMIIQIALTERMRRDVPVTLFILVHVYIVQVDVSTLYTYLYMSWIHLLN